MGILIKFAIFFLLAIGSVYIYLYYTKNKSIKMKGKVAFRDRRADITSFIGEFYTAEFLKENLEKNWPGLVERFKQDYPDYYKRIDKKFLDNYFNKF